MRPTRARRKPSPGGAAGGTQRGRAAWAGVTGRMRAAWGWGAAVALLAVLPYLNTLSAGFTLDDFPVIVENEHLRRPIDLGRIFTSNFWGERETASREPGAPERAPELRSLFRPVTSLSYALDHAGWGLAPRGFHAVNVVLHALVSAALYWLALRLLGSPSAALVAAGVFAAHPIHTEAVASVTGRSELLAALFFLLALGVSTTQWFAGVWRTRPAPLAEGVAPVSGANRAPRHPAWAAALVATLYFLGLGSKEHAVTLPAVLAAVAFALTLTRRTRGRGEPHRTDGAKDASPATSPARPGPPAGRDTLLRWGAVGLGLVLALAAFLALRGIAVAPRRIAWAGFVGVPDEQRILTASRILMEYLGLLAWPRTLSAEYWIPEVPIARSPLDPAVAASLLLWLALAAAAVWSARRAPVIALGIAWFFVTLLPTSNLAFPIGIAKAERLLYLPSAGICLALGGGVALVGTKARAGTIALLLVPALAALSLRTWARNRDWRDNLTLGLATLRTSPASPLFNRIVGISYRSNGEFARAQPYLEATVREGRPELAADHYNLANNLFSLGRFAEAERELSRALELRPDWLDALNNLGRVQMQAGRDREATRTLGRALELYPRVPGVYLNLGSAHLNLGEAGEAERIFRAGLEVAPTDARMHFNLAVALRAQGRTEESLEERRRAVTLEPEAATWAF